MDNRSIVVKKADKDSCVIEWDRCDYVKQAEKQLGDGTVYEEINFNKKILSLLVDSSYKSFRKLDSSDYISYNEMMYFTFEYKKACNLGKLHVSPKICNRLLDVPEKSVIPCFRTHIDKVSEFLNYHLKPIMQSNIGDSQPFSEKMKNIGNAILVSAVGLYFNVSHQAGLKALKQVLEKRDLKKILTGDLVNVVEFVLDNNMFKFNNKEYQQNRYNYRN